jgi:hypothetical protein
MFLRSGWRNGSASGWWLCSWLVHPIAHWPLSFCLLLIYKPNLQPNASEWVPSRCLSVTGIFQEFRVSLWWREHSICHLPFLLFADSLTRTIPYVNPQSFNRVYASSGVAKCSSWIGQRRWAGGSAAIASAICARSSGVCVEKRGYSGRLNQEDDMLCLSKNIIKEEECEVCVFSPFTATVCAVMSLHHVNISLIFIRTFDF